MNATQRQVLFSLRISKASDKNLTAGGWLSVSVNCISHFLGVNITF